MKYTTVLFLLIFIILISKCNSEKKKEAPVSPSKTIALYRDSVQVTHASLPVVIPVEGFLEPWKQMELSLPDSARLLSVLAEPGFKVNKGDIIASLWKISRFGENTPIDLLAPISGRVEQVYFKINQVAPANKPIICLYNTDRLVLKAKLNDPQLAFVKENQRVKLDFNGRERIAYVRDVNLPDREIVISLENKKHLVNERTFVKGEIECGKLRGDFLKSVYCEKRDSIKVQLAENILLTVFPVGTADSLTLIYPPLPAQNYIRIYEKNLDL